MAKENNEVLENEKVQAKATVTLTPGKSYVKSAKVNILTGYAKLVVQNTGGADVIAAIVDPTWIDEVVKMYTVKAGTTLSKRVAIPKNTYYLELSNNYLAGSATGSLNPTN